MASRTGGGNYWQRLGQAIFAGLIVFAGVNVADEVAPFDVLSGVGPGQPWFDTRSFAAVTAARFGTSKANGYRGPGYANLDASVFRTFRLSQSVTAQLRLEALNVTNTPHWANPGTNVNAIDFGQITFTANPGREYDERNLRIGVRVTF